MLYFEKQMELARKTGMPVVIHDREAHGDCLDMIKKFPTVKGVFHSFSGSPEMANELVKLGWYISFSGTVTYKNAKQPKEACRVVPDDRLLIETDAPYLAPEPVRGTRNESKNIKYVIEKLSEIKDIDVETLQNILYDNSIKLFRI